MARRRIGQEDLIARPEARVATALTEIAALLDWAEIDRALVSISAAAKGEPGWPPLVLFRALLLATWHDLSDVRLAEALDDRASFRRFCGFAAHEPTPERTAFVRFRRELVRRGLDRALFAAVTRQLEAKGVTVCAGTLVDATLVPSASIRRDAEARWAGHRRRKPVHGYKAHVATDEGAGLVRGIEVTTANAHDAAELGRGAARQPGRGLRRQRFRRLTLRRHDPSEGRRARHRRDRHLGRTGRAGTAGGAQRSGPARALPDREGVRHMEAELRPATNAMARSRQGGAAGTARRHGLQPAPNAHSTAHRDSLTREESACSASGAV